MVDVLQRRPRRQRDRSPARTLLQDFFRQKAVRFDEKGFLDDTFVFLERTLDPVDVIAVPTAASLGGDCDKRREKSRSFQGRQSARPRQERSLLGGTSPTNALRPCRFRRLADVGGDV